MLVKTISFEISLPVNHDRYLSSTILHVIHGSNHIMIWDQWLTPVKPHTEYTKFKHFEFEERPEERANIENDLAHLVHIYHTRSHTNSNLVATLGYSSTAQALTGDQRPKSIDNRRGHLAEILACEFARQQLAYDLPVYRLRYNPNPDQSMKGDDILGFRFPTTTHATYAVLVGEAKYRSQYASDAVMDAYKALCRGFRPYPVSVEFVATILQLEGDRDRAQQVRRVKNLLTSISTDVSRSYLLLIATEGRPRDPFGCLDALGDVLGNLIVVNVSFQSGIGEWIDQIYEQEINP